MRRWGVIAALAFGLVMARARSAWAVPIIDGVFSAGEWDSFFLGGSDANESDITDNWDINAVRFVSENSGGSDDGLYFLMTTFDTPIFDGGPGSFGNSAFFQFALDVNGDGLLTNSVDRIITYNDPFLNDQVVRVRDGTGTLLGTGTGALGGSVELFVSESLLPSDLSSLQGFARLDNGGDEPDDRIPNSGFFTPVPEPGSAMLLGFGLLGAIGVSRSRRRRGARA